MKPFLTVLFCLVYTLSIAQNLSQTIRGTVVDQNTKIRLSSVSLVILGSDPLQGTITDANGKFEIPNVKVGRQNIKVSCIGYNSKTLTNLLITSGKELVLVVELSEQTTKLETVTVKGSRQASSSDNLAFVSSKSFTGKETRVYAGGIGDLARLVSSYAGAIKESGYDRNGIVIRGNSPMGLLWRLEGVEIPNPNHFASSGSSSGALTVFSDNILAKSDFYTGAFPAKYGNALSGVLDLNLRAGNDEKTEYSFQAGILGIEASGEGPFNKNGKSSFLINYRYSTLSLFNKIGIEIVSKDDITNYQDLCFKFNFPTDKYGTLSIFGVGGLSNNHYNSATYNYNEKVNTDLGVIGTNHFIHLTPKAYLKSTLSLSGSKIKSNANDIVPRTNYSYRESKKKWDFRANSSLHLKINKLHSIQTGVTFSSRAFNYSEIETNHGFTYLNNNETFEYLDSKGRANSIQHFISWKYQLSDQVTLVNGIHFLYFDLNKEWAIEPRNSINWQVSSKHSLSFAFGMHSRIESLNNYLAQYPLANGDTHQPNKNLDFTKALHYVMGYNYHPNNNWNISLETYYQHLYNVPVYNNYNSIFSTITMEDQYLLEPLVNKGSGKNYGIDLSLHYSRENDFYFLCALSLFKSTYKTLDNIKKNSPYASDFGLSLYSGKEIEIGKNNQNLISFNIGGTWNGNMRYIPIDSKKSSGENKIIFDFENAYKNRFPNYFAIDFNMSFYLNKKNISHEFRFDLLNVTNRFNVMSNYYNDINGMIEHDLDTGIIPAITYRVEF